MPSVAHVSGHLVTIGSYSAPFEASLAKAELECFDIEATLADEETMIWKPRMTNRTPMPR